MLHLIKQIKTCLNDNNYPVLIDEEGGRVSRINNILSTKNFSAKLNPRLTLKLKAENVLVDFGTGRKIIYNGFKSNNDILITEHFKTKGHSLLKIELEGTF